MLKFIDFKVMGTSGISILSISLLQRIAEFEPIISFGGQMIIWLLSIIYLIRKIISQKK